MPGESSCVVVLCGACLEPTGEVYPNLIAREFLATHTVRALQGNICNIAPALDIALLNLRAVTRMPSREAKKAK